MTRSLTTPRGTITIRESEPTDAELFRQLRLEALQDSPVAFSADYERNLSQPAKYWEDMLTMYSDESTILLAVHGNSLVGTTGIVRGGSPKTRHAAVICGVYVSP